MENLNMRNVALTKDDVNQILRKADINKEINDITKFQQAFTHKSYVKDSSYTILNNIIKLKEGVVDFQDKCYETYEFYGDSIVGSTTHANRFGGPPAL